VVVDLAPSPAVPEGLIVGNERAVLTWFYDGATARPEAIEPDGGGRAPAQHLGPRRRARQHGDISRRLYQHRANRDVDDGQGQDTDRRHGRRSKGLGAKVGEMVRMVAAKVEVETVPDSGHFLPEENPQAVIRQVLAMAAKA
jgi:pimeloyl-ACP methyl ester carboxylesterase